MPAIFALFAQYAPLIFGFVQTAETVFSAFQGKTGPAKLAAVASAVVAASPAIGQLIQANPTNSNHLNDYINGSVELMKSMNTWAEQQGQTATMAANP